MILALALEECCLPRPSTSRRATSALLLIFRFCSVPILENFARTIFTNGLDIKTQGVTGKPIHCIADGYVSRVAVLHGGYGQVIYVTHPNGLTSVYGHVISFAKNIQAYVRQYQYAHETFVCDLKFQPRQFPVKKGDIIALSGNEGASAGPHLHLELRRTETGEYIDPMPYFKHLLKDSKAPVGSLIGIYPIQGKRGWSTGPAIRNSSPSAT